MTATYQPRTCRTCGRRLRQVERDLYVDQCGNCQQLISSYPGDYGDRDATTPKLPRT